MIARGLVAGRWMLDTGSEQVRVREQRGGRGRFADDEVLQLRADAFVAAGSSLVNQLWFPCSTLTPLTYR